MVEKVLRCLDLRGKIANALMITTHRSAAHEPEGLLATVEFCSHWPRLRDFLHHHLSRDCLD